MTGKWEEVCVSLELVKLATYLLDNFVEEATRELGLDLLLNPPVRGDCQGHSAPRRSCGSRVYCRLSPKYIALTLGLTSRYRISKLDPTYYSCLGFYWTKDSWNATQQASNVGER